MAAGATIRGMRSLQRKLDRLERLPDGDDMAEAITSGGDVIRGPRRQSHSAHLAAVRSARESVSVFNMSQRSRVMARVGLAVVTVARSLRRSIRRTIGR